MAKRSNQKMTAKSVISTIGSVAATAMVARSVIKDFIPPEIRRALFSTFHSTIIRRFSSDLVMIIEEFDGLEHNHIFEAAELYLGARTKITSPSSVTRLRVRKSEADKQIHTTVDKDEEIIDRFEGIKFQWMLRCRPVEAKTNYNSMNGTIRVRSEARTFHLTFNKKFKEIALNKYLPHITKEAEFLKQQAKPIKLYTVDPNNLYGSGKAAWNSICLNHPATFDTIAMDWDLKERIIEDLQRFVERKEYYRRVGKAWKRGYLLYGPPGTGKSSLIAAIANYLKFDVYDLEIGGVNGDAGLRKSLLGTNNKSIVVVEDIDCSVGFQDRVNLPVNTRQTSYAKPQVTLSGLLNFMDGLWSSVGDERIIIFTTNHKNKLDPALLRPGRMDLHIHMSYCTPCGFNLLAYNYLGIKHHELFADIETMLKVVQVTPADVAEQLMRHNEPDAALTGLVEFLKAKKVQTEKAKAKKLEDESKAKSKSMETKEETNSSSNNTSRDNVTDAKGVDESVPGK